VPRRGSPRKAKNKEINEDRLYRLQLEFKVVAELVDSIHLFIIIHQPSRADEGDGRVLACPGCGVTALCGKVVE
jgi:hypothetical protein